MPTILGRRPKPADRVIRAAEPVRPQTASRGYDHLWRKTSERYRRKHPFCRFCEQVGRQRLCDDVDHIIPIDDGGDRLKLENLQPVCRPCHTQASMFSALPAFAYFTSCPRAAEHASRLRRRFDLRSRTTPMAGSVSALSAPTRSRRKTGRPILQGHLDEIALQGRGSRAVVISTPDGDDASFCAG